MTAVDDSPDSVSTACFNLSFDNSQDLIMAGNAVQDLANHPRRVMNMSERLSSRINEIVDDGTQLEQTDIATSFTKIVEFGVDNIKEEWPTLVRVLDDVAKIHPFVSIAVVAFKAALDLQMTRIANDQRVWALHADMCNMMSVLILLKPLTHESSFSEQDVKARLHSIIKRIASALKECAQSCDQLLSQGSIVRTLSGYKWEAKLNGFERLFATLRAELQNELAMYAVIGISQTNRTLVAVDHKVDTIVYRLENSCSPEERRLLDFVKEHVDVETIWQSADLRSDFEQLCGQIKSFNEDRLISCASDLWDEIQVNIRSTVEALLNEHQQIFERKWKIQVQNIAANTRLELSSSGRAEFGIVDEDLRKFWIGAGWLRESRVAITDFIPRLLEFSRTLAQVTPDERVRSSHKSAVYTVAEDQWVGDYLLPSHQQGLCEAFMSDKFSKVTIRMLNKFASPKPDHWSLPRWLAYWTVGTALGLKSYCKCIKSILSEMRQLATDVLPINRLCVQKLLGEGVFYTCDCLISGINYMDVSPAQAPGLKMEHGDVNTGFQELDAEEEKRLQSSLESLKYEIDDSNTLELVVGGRNFDKTVLPILYLLLKQSLSIIKHGTVDMIEQKQMNVLRKSLWTLLRASYHRIERISEQYDSSRVCFGLYHYVYRYDLLGETRYVRDEYTLEAFTPGSAYYVHNSQPKSSADLKQGQITGASLNAAHAAMWTYPKVKEILSDINHPMYTFVQLCVEHSIMAPEDSDITGKEAFIKMAQEATFKAKRRNKLEIESIYEKTSTHPQRRAPIYEETRPEQFAPRNDPSSSVNQVSGIEQLAEKHAEDLPFYTALVDHIVRRQIIHSPVACNKCRKLRISMTRLLCLQCMEDAQKLHLEGFSGTGQTVDFCSRCLFEDFQLKCPAMLVDPRSTYVPPSSYHAFLQIRHFTFGKWNPGTSSQEQALARKRRVYAPKSSVIAHTCHLCNSSISLPFWVCIDCDKDRGRVNICHDCNLASERMVNMLTLEDILINTAQIEAQLAPDHHHWSHTLVLVVSFSTDSKHVVFPPKVASSPGSRSFASAPTVPILPEDSSRSIRLGVDSDQANMPGSPGPINDQSTLDTDSSSTLFGGLSPMMARTLSPLPIESAPDTPPTSFHHSHLDYAFADRSESHSQELGLTGDGVQDWYMRQNNNTGQGTESMPQHQLQVGAVNYDSLPFRNSTASSAGIERAPRKPQTSQGMHRSFRQDSMLSTLNGSRPGSPFTMRSFSSHSSNTPRLIPSSQVYPYIFCGQPSMTQLSAANMITAPPIISSVATVPTLFQSPRYGQRSSVNLPHIPSSPSTTLAGISELSDDSNPHSLGPEAHPMAPQARSWQSPQIAHASSYSPVIIPPMQPSSMVAPSTVDPTQVPSGEHAYVPVVSATQPYNQTTVTGGSPTMKVTPTTEAAATPQASLPQTFHISYAPPGPAPIHEQHFMSNDILREVRSLSDRLHAMEKSVAKRVYKKLSPHLRDHVETTSQGQHSSTERATSHTSTIPRSAVEQQVVEDEQEVTAQMASSLQRLVGLAEALTSRVAMLEQSISAQSESTTERNASDDDAGPNTAEANSHECSAYTSTAAANTPSDDKVDEKARRGFFKFRHRRRKQ